MTELSREVAWPKLLMSTRYGLGSSANLMIVGIFLHHDRIPTESMYSYKDINRLSSRTGFSKEELSSLIDQLIELGWIEIVKHKLPDWTILDVFRLRFPDSLESSYPLKDKKD